MSETNGRAIRGNRFPVLAALLCSALLTHAPHARAQFGAPSGGTAQPVATELPLSGRTGQSGSVAAADQPVPGTTTSVDTLNPTVQVSGPYSGSASSIAKMPFSGKLSLREALARGLAYNLGAVGLAQMCIRDRIFGFKRFGNVATHVRQQHASRHAALALGLAHTLREAHGAEVIRCLLYTSRCV